MTSSTPDIQEIFCLALEQQTPEQLREFLDHACQGNEAVRTEVEALLVSHQTAGSFLPGYTHPANDDQTDGRARSTDAVAQSPSAEEVPLDFLEPSDHSDALGRLGQYEILEVVGRGGMGIVLKAQDAKLNRIVAVKVLAPELASNATARKRFAREAQAAAAVSHDHVVTIYMVEEADRADSLPYLVMEFIDGQSLEQKIDRQGHLELREILRIGRQTAAGLAAAHEQGLIHRDVKPANILLQNGVERVQITDFGLARAVDDVGMTRTGEVAGTPQFMSPEQAQGEPVDARSDLFSLGSVLYAMCTGRSPFRADSTMASLRRVCDDAPRPIRDINPEIPKWLAAIVDRLLEKKPEDRFQSAAEVAELLGQRLAHVQNPQSTPLPGAVSIKKQKPSRGHWPHRWAIASSILVVLLALTTIGEATGVTHFAGTVIRLVTGEGTLVIEVDDPSVQVSLDGELLTISGAGIQELTLRPGQYQFRATRDGRPVVQQLVSITRGDREVVKVTRESAAIAADTQSMSPDYTSLPQRAITEIDRFDRAENRHLVSGLTFSADGAELLCTRVAYFLEVWNLKTKQSSLIKETGIQLAVPPRGNVVATASYDQDRVMLWSLDTLRKISELAPSEVSKRKGYVEVSLSPDARRVAAAGHDGAARVWDVDTEKQIRHFQGDGQCLSVAFSPDGRTLLAGFSTTLQLLDLESGKAIWRVDDPGYTHAAAFSPSGRWVIRAASRSITLLDASTGEETHRFLGHSEVIRSLQFLPDSRHFLSGSLDRTMRLWNVETGREVARVTTTNHVTNWVAVSPDGRYAASGGGRFYDGGEVKKDGDYAIRLWRLPESVWPDESAAGSAAETKEKSPRRQQRR